jgi:hypothetical protein
VPLPGQVSEVVNRVQRLVVVGTLRWCSSSFWTTTASMRPLSSAPVTAEGV